MTLTSWTYHDLALQGWQMRLKNFIACAIILFLCEFSWAENWPQWRGPRGDGISSDMNVPVRWSEKESISWKIPIPGKGLSSPVVWGDRIFITTCLEKEQKRLL